MSTKTVIEFLEKVQEDSNLQAELAKAMEAEDDRTEVVKLANSKGYEFTSGELWAEIQKRQDDLKKRQENGELSDEELEAVAGGATPTISIATLLATGAIPGGVVGISVSKIKW